MAQPVNADLGADLTAALGATRSGTLALVAGLDDDTLHAQHSAIMGPIVWDLGHIGNFEARWLLRELGRGPRVERELDRIYDAFLNPRSTRASLDLLDRASVLPYLLSIRQQVLEGLARQSFPAHDPLLAGGFVYRMVVQHEAQHQETILQSLDLRGSPFQGSGARPHCPPRAPVDARERIWIPAGPASVGVDASPCAYDNERPRRVCELPRFGIDRFPVTCDRYRAFMDDHGYARAELWSARGWAWRCRNEVTAPQGWAHGGSGGWEVVRFGRRVPLDGREPIQHVSWYEADAFARFAGGRLPTELEWEKAASWDPEVARARIYPWGEEPPGPGRANLGHRRAGPAPVGSYPAGASAYGVEQMVGDVYEWTRSRFEGYPGFRAFPYREYSEVFFGDAYRVLRGASWATSHACARASFRNWDFPQRRQIFAGFRLAWDR